MTNLRIATWNVNGLAPNTHEVTILLAEHKLDILLVSEAHCTASTSVKINDFQCYTTHHPDGTGHGGTAVVIKKSIKHHLWSEYKSDAIQATTVTVEDQTGPLNVCAVYCPPRHKLTEQMFTDFFGTLGSRYVIGGDWNSKHTHWGSRLITTKGRQLKQAIDQQNLFVISTGQPTYWPTDANKRPDLIDFFVAKGLSRHYFKPEPCHDSSSDHTPVLLTISTMLIEYELPESLYNRRTDWESFRNYIEENIVLKIALKTPEDIEEATKYITSLIQVACWISTPTINSKKGHTDKPLEIKKALLEKRRLRRVWHSSRLTADRVAFNQSAAELKEMLQTWHNDTLETKLESLTATASTNYSLWKFTNNFNRPQEAKPPLRTNAGWARTPQEKANCFAEHLSKVFTPNETGTASHMSIDEILNQDFQLSPPPKPVSVREVWKTITNLKDKKAPGFDLVTKEILKELPRKATVFLTMLFNGILRVQYFPRLWKVSQILMVYKPGKPVNDIKSYRPISLLPILSKIFEKLLLFRITPILQINKIIPQHQFGFRQQHSTVEQVHRVCDKIRQTLENKEYCASAFLDIQQAFDRVWHRGLLCKIKSSLPHSYFTVIHSYLTDRIFQVKESDATSSFFEIKAGVPQGSVLGPVLYTIYTSDLPQVDGVITATFADDTALLASSKDPTIASTALQEGLDAVTEWLKKWKIRASASKSVQVTFTLKKGDCPPVQLENTTLPHQDCVRYLGLHLDRRLTWRPHIKKKRDELNMKYRNLYWLVSRNSKLSTDNKLLIYKTILKPVWMYGIQLWGSACNTNISIMQRMQNSILRAISNVPWFITNNEIHENLHMNTVKQEISNCGEKYRKRLENHPNELATQLTKRSYKKRLKRKDII
ncbi:hypothetical protein O0L34_g11971 [Tuta absoluta]|nr:hypothetical protein O0L34_g11971 [Tuta absoluta]